VGNCGGPGQKRSPLGDGARQAAHSERRIFTHTPCAPGNESGPEPVVGWRRLSCRAGSSGQRPQRFLPRQREAAGTGGRSRVGGAETAGVRAGCQGGEFATSFGKVDPLPAAARAWQGLSGSDDFGEVANLPPRHLCRGVGAASRAAPAATWPKATRWPGSWPRRRRVKTPVKTTKSRPVAPQWANWPTRPGFSGPSRPFDRKSAVRGG